MATDINQRIHSANEFFSQVVEQLELPSLVGEDAHWAIVGGAVRDYLLSTDPCKQSQCLAPSWGYWPDIDIAVANSPCDGADIIAAATKRRLSVSMNSYGGWKLQGDQYGTVDVWLISLGDLVDRSIAEWQDHLNLIDFGLNAAAFVWPQREVVVNQQFLEDLAARTIRPLAQLPLRRELYAIRAIALAAKMRRLVAASFELDPSITENLQCLTSSRKSSEIEIALDYLKEKITTGRWHNYVLHAFVKECRRSNMSSQFRQQFRQTFSCSVAQKSSARDPRPVQMKLLPWDAVGS